MPKSLKYDESLHKDQHDANVIFLVVNSIDEAGQENDKAGNNSYDEPAKRKSGNLETSFTRKQDKRHKSKKRKINSLSLSPEIVKRSNKRDKSSQGQGGKKERGSLPHPYLL